MTPEQKKEEISKAYVHAVAARCGFVIATWSQDQGCVDSTIGSAGTLGKGLLEDPKLDIQIKATARSAVEHETHLAVQLQRSHYDKLRTAQRSIPIVLVVLLLPENETDRIAHSADALILRRCAYWVSLRGAPPITGDSKLVHVPKTNLFSPQQLQAMLETISEERWK